MEDPDLGTPSYDLEQQIDAEFSNLHRSISRITAEVYKCVPEADTRTLQAAVKESLANIRANIRVLEELAEEQDSDEEAERLLLKVSERKRSYEALQLDLRKAVRQMRKNAEEVAVEERRALIGSPDAIQKQQKIEREGDLAGAAESVTASLQRTRQQMTQELENTAATLAAMEVSEATLKDAKNEFQGHKASHKRSHKLMGTMRRHSLLDILTLWGGISMFMLVVLYIVGKRSLYFVPGFAKNFVTAPFRSRNATAVATSKKSEVVKQQGGWEGRGEAALPDYPPAGTVPDYEQHFGPDDVPAEVKMLQNQSQTTGSMQEVLEEVDLGRSGDAEAGLKDVSEGMAGEALKREAARMEEAFKESVAATEKLAAYAYPDPFAEVSQSAAAVPSPAPVPASTPTPAAESEADTEAATAEEATPEAAPEAVQDPIPVPVPMPAATPAATPEATHAAQSAAAPDTASASGPEAAQAAMTDATSTEVTALKDEEATISVADASTPPAAAPEASVPSPAPQAMPASSPQTAEGEAEARSEVGFAASPADLQQSAVSGEGEDGSSKASEGEDAPGGAVPGSQTEEPALPAGWSPHTVADGRTYYWNAATQVSTWERPTEAPGSEIRGSEQQSATSPPPQTPATPVATEGSHPVSTPPSGDDTTEAATMETPRPAAETPALVSGTPASINLTQGLEAVKDTVATLLNRSIGRHSAETGAEALDERDRDQSSGTGDLAADEEVDVFDPVRESSTELDKDAWGKGGKVLGEEDRTTRQEDTEIGLFRPDEL